MIAPEYVDVDDVWLAKRGNLHDARVTSVIQSNGNLLVGIDDQWANFEASDSYPGLEGGTLVVQGLIGAPRIDAGAFIEMISEATIGGSEDGISLVVACFGQHVIAGTGRKVVWQKPPDTV